jgi:hypothetical protein
MAKQECVDLAAGVKDVDACTHQERAACFGKYFLLQKQSVQACAPTIGLCKARRTNAVKHFSDDIRVTSECQPRD